MKYFKEIEDDYLKKPYLVYPVDHGIKKTTIIVAFYNYLV